MIRSSTTSRPAGLAAWLRVLVIALLVALAVPAFAIADEGTAGTATTAEGPAATADQPAVATEQAPPAAEQPAPVATDSAPVTTTPAPVAEQPAPAEPQAPPPASEPAPAPPAASGGTTAIDIPIPVIDLPAVQLPVPVIPEVLPGEPPVPAGQTAAPVPGVGELVPVLVAPEAPRPPSIGTIAPAEPPRAALPVTVSAAVVSTQGTDLVAPFDLGGPLSLGGADPVSGAPRTAADGPAFAEAASAPLHGSLISLDPSHRPDPSGPAVGAGPAQSTVAFGQKEEPARIAAPRLVAPGGPAPAQSLLAVLASYILPGTGPVPAGTLFLLVMLGVILGAAVAPRLGGSERIWLSGLLGPRRGHGLAVRRPG